MLSEANKHTLETSPDFVAPFLQGTPSHHRTYTMGLQDLFIWRSQAAAATMPGIADDDVVADVDEPPDHHQAQHHPEFQKSVVRALSDRKESLLTMALKTPELTTSKPDVHIHTDLSRRRSMISNTSLASTAELTSDGLTSPSRTNTPSPPPPNGMFTSLGPFSLLKKPEQCPMPTTPSAPPVDNTESKGPAVGNSTIVLPKTEPATPVIPKKRCITFACGGRKDQVTKPSALPVSQPVTPDVSAKETPKQRACTIKFACTAPKPSDKLPGDEQPMAPQTSKPLELSRKSSSRSPSATRKSPRPSLTLARSHRDSNSTIRRSSQSPAATRSRPRYITTDEKALPSSEATRFHEFASEEVEEDDWIRTDSDNTGKRLTINDTLKLENDIRRLGNEAEAEALEDEQEAEENENENDSDDENPFDEDEDEDVDTEDDDASDGNETDNEAGFAESDESDIEGEFAFWTPGREVAVQSGEVSAYRTSVHRTASTSSIESLTRSTSTNAESGAKARRRPRPIKIRPGTPDLPDSTDFVCGTLDEDRPLEEAYVSCMEARKNAKHKQTPQDIDPSFPTSDVEDEDEDDDAIQAVHDSDEHVWLHGKFEDSADERHGRHRSTSHRKSPGQSPKRLRSPPPPRRLHSPPPAKTRLRSPPPRKLFGHSPRRMRSPPPARMIRSPPASLMTHAAVGFAPLGSRPGLTHTKSLPRTPNAFCRQYHASRLIAANGNYNDLATDGHVRGAIDIVKGLEQKRQRRKEKFFAKHYNRKGKGQTDRRPQPGIGAERMRELGLLMAGKPSTHDPYILSA